MSESMQAKPVTVDMLVSLENPNLLPVKVISGEDMETSNLKWQVAYVLKTSPQIELNSPEVKRKAASADLLLEIPYRIEKPPPGTHYRVTLLLTYGVTKTPGSICMMTVQFGGRTKVVRHEYGRNENQAVIDKRYGLDIRASEARSGSLILGISLFAERNSLMDNVIFTVDSIDLSVTVVNSTSARRNR